MKLWLYSHVFMAILPTIYDHIAEQVYSEIAKKLWQYSFNNNYTTILAEIHGYIAMDSWQYSHEYMAIYLSTI